MCRYSMHPSKTHFACLPCRFTAKHWGAYWREPNVHCPHCGGLMIDLGHDFKAPRRGNECQWRKVDMLVAAGITFDSCGCNGPGPRPKTLSDAKSQLHRRRSDVKFAEEEKLAKWSKFQRRWGREVFRSV
jgi:hypothetical protein